jgi:hypothetical protein
MNLLPKTEKEALKKGLKLRFAVLAMFLLSLSFLVGFIMLLPSYFMVFGYFSKETSGNYFSGSKNDDSVKEILNLPSEISLKLSFFQSNMKDISVADYFSKIVGHLPQEVHLNSILLSRNQNYNKKVGTVILVSGMAADRESLVSFSTLLKKSNSFSAVDVPVSSLTKNKDLPFSMSIFIENQK